QRVSLGPSRILVHAHISEVAPGATRFLDVGCGIGQFAWELAESRPGSEVVGVDPSAAMIDRARNAFRHPRATYLHGYVRDVDPGPGFDVVTCMHAFPYIRDGGAALARIREVLRPGGRVLIVGANTENAWDRVVLRLVKLTTTPAQYRPVAEIRRLMREAGFAPGAVRRVETPFYVASIHLVEGVLA
ncbi:MAG: class I SAM-dependent methyltransferase, partial [Deltaproteobacteria bacterium]|nr:class I SAM-dependent methyltransferase [Deltaproteobacteria bacterium]